MTVSEIMQTIMVEKGITKAQLGRAVGIADNKATDLISKRIKHKNPSLNVLAEMLGAMGYTIKIVPAGSKVREGEYEVTVNE